ncbi:LptA/OstA family protein, partial [Salmonella enterica]|uniref:LptA/OstA family protein n=1 Tax=Salmonella enterica TaxID=28901 RepID=UPI003D277055
TRAPAPAAPGPAAIDTPDSPPGPGETVRFEADKVTYDDNADLVTATGSVVLRRAAQTVRADAVTWNRKTGQIVGTG